MVARRSRSRALSRPTAASASSPRSASTSRDPREPVGQAEPLRRRRRRRGRRGGAGEARLQQRVVAVELAAHPVDAGLDRERERDQRGGGGETDVHRALAPALGAPRDLVERQPEQRRDDLARAAFAAVAVRGRRVDRPQVDRPLVRRAPAPPLRVPEAQRRRQAFQMRDAGLAGDHHRDHARGPAHGLEEADLRVEELAAARRRASTARSGIVIPAAPQPFARRARRRLSRRSRWQRIGASVAGTGPAGVQRPTRSFPMRQASSARRASRPKPRRDGRTSSRRAAATHTTHSRTPLPRRRLPDASASVAQIFSSWWCPVAAHARARACTRVMSLECVAIRAQKIFSRNIFRARALARSLRALSSACVALRVQTGVCTPCCALRCASRYPLSVIARSHFRPLPNQGRRICCPLPVGEGCSALPQRTGEGASSQDGLSKKPPHPSFLRHHQGALSQRAPGLPGSRL